MFGLTKSKKSFVGQAINVCDVISWVYCIQLRTKWIINEYSIIEWLFRREIRCWSIKSSNTKFIVYWGENWVKNSLVIFW